MLRYFSTYYVILILTYLDYLMLPIVAYLYLSSTTHTDRYDCRLLNCNHVVDSFFLNLEGGKRRQFCITLDAI